MPDYEDISNRYEKKHLQNIARTNERIREVFSDAIHTLTLSAGRIRFEGEVFDLSKYPALKAQIDEVLKEMGGNIYTALVNSIEASWGLANEKNDILVDRRLAGKKPNAAGRSILYDPNKQALEAFIKRKDKGLDLSKRIWNSLEPFKSEMEKGLALGISEGKSAREMSREIRQFLNEPDKLFRRVRDAKGKLKLSKAAKEYHPGQGVARSSFSNATRLTVTETNMAYRSSDHERWKNLPFVKAIEVRLSNNHPKYDVCDSMVGIFPADYKHVGFHPRCRCYAVPVMASDEEYERLEGAILEGKEPPPIDRVQDIHPSAKEWIRENAERIRGWKNVPYFLKDNPQYTKDLLRKK